MATIMATKKATQTFTLTPEVQLDINKETLKFWRDEAGYYEGLALDVDKKVDAGEPLTKLEQGILMCGLSRDHVNLVKEHFWSL
jgi:hypothetical protein